ncbi:hypothetical protein EVAR_28125_1 [Eumeta japonica]|uniref:Uncharacterized protein n=1 Tax=Eumeta variegata TaxID=151549 RepID=A0A4C1VFN4_EUMVA|nr:hypothetical protein EVAR_28125_1 [Eumeta japonica]
MRRLDNIPARAGPISKFPTAVSARTYPLYSISKHLCAFPRSVLVVVVEETCTDHIHYRTLFSILSMPHSPLVNPPLPVVRTGPVRIEVVSVATTTSVTDNLTCFLKHGAS